MNRAIIKTTLLSLILILCAVFTAADQVSVPVRLERVHDFFKAHFIGNTLIHQHYMLMDDGTSETEIRHRHTYTNLTKGKDFLSFDVFAIVTHANYKLDRDGKRRDETRSVSQRNVSLTRYTVHGPSNASQPFSGSSRCLSHTTAGRIDTVATIQLWFEEGTLKLMSHTLLPAKSAEEGEAFLPIMHINMQDFWVEDQQLLSRSRFINYNMDADTLALTPQGSDETDFMWHQERNRVTHFLETLAPIKAREDRLVEAMKKNGNETTFLVMREGYLYPCKVVGGIMESLPLQANVQTYHDDSHFRTVFYELLLPRDVNDSLYTMEIFNGTQWEPTTNFQWDGNAYLSKTDQESEAKKHTFNQVRFKK